MFEFYQIRKNKIHKFKPKFEIHSEKGPFILKTVTDSEELIRALRLRYKVFYHEMMGKTKARGIDIDEYDFICDHLVIKDKKINKIIGTYRMNCSEFSENFYSAKEFDLQNLMGSPGVKLELGRACIHPDYRKGAVIALLWRGIADYMQASNADVLFGCATVMTESPRQAALLYHYFNRQGLFDKTRLCPPTKKYTLPNLDLWIRNMDRAFTPEEESEIEALIPPLFRSYLRIGATLGGEPAWDADFKCIDFLTILPRENLNKTLWKKYNITPNAESPANNY